MGEKKRLPEAVKASGRYVLVMEFLEFLLKLSC